MQYVGAFNWIRSSDLVTQAVRDSCVASIQDDKKHQPDVTPEPGRDANLTQQRYRKPASETYRWLLTPEIDRSVDMKTILWMPTASVKRTDIKPCPRKMQQCRAETLITGTCCKWNWTKCCEDADHIQIKKLWRALHLLLPPRLPSSAC